MDEITEIINELISKWLGKKDVIFITYENGNIIFGTYSKRYIEEYPSTYKGYSIVVRSSETHKPFKKQRRGSVRYEINNFPWNLIVLYYIDNLYEYEVNDNVYCGYKADACEDILMMVAGLDQDDIDKIRKGTYIIRIYNQESKTWDITNIKAFDKFKYHKYWEHIK